MGKRKSKKERRAEWRAEMQARLNDVFSRLDFDRKSREKLVAVINNARNTSHDRRAA